MHEIQPPSYIMKATNHNYVNKLNVRSANPCQNPFIFSSFLSPIGPRVWNVTGNEQTNQQQQKNQSLFVGRVLF